MKSFIFCIADGGWFKGRFESLYDAQEFAAMYENDHGEIVTVTEE